MFFHRFSHNFSSEDFFSFSFSLVLRFFSPLLAPRPQFSLNKILMRNREKNNNTAINLQPSRTSSRPPASTPSSHCVFNFFLRLHLHRFVLCWVFLSVECKREQNSPDCFLGAADDVPSHLTHPFFKESPGQMRSRSLFHRVFT